MTTAQDPPGAASPRLELATVAPELVKAMAHLEHAVTRELDAAGVDQRLRELLRIRASQLNGCAFCLDMHTKDARALGEAEQRIYALPAWRETPFFTEKERAALAFAEAVTLVAADHVPDDVYDDAAALFGPEGMAALVGLVVAINAWNRLSVSTRSPVPGSYQR